MLNVAFGGGFELSPTGARELAFGREGLHDLRGLVATEAETAGLSRERTTDLALAASELGANSVRGLWMANQVCDLVRIRSGETGTAVRLHMSLS